MSKKEHDTSKGTEDSKTVRYINRNESQKGDKQVQTDESVKPARETQSTGSKNNP
ncbi:MAG TPA: hypothetical protein PKZ42_01835 [Syntrophales bacterium]|nr:hypothetical protein [Syntrophales bacterium]